MIKIFLSLFLFMTVYVNAQDSLQSYSYYFKNNECNVYELANSINLKTWGTYELIPSTSNEMRVTAGDDLVVDENGVYISKNKLLSISREEVRENSKYKVKNGFLHGILVNDSLPTFLQDESYYFLMPTKAYLYNKENKTQTLYQVAPYSYFVFTQEDNGYYSALKITFNAGKVSLSELDLTYNQVDGLSSKLTTENQIKTYLLTPTKQEWEFMMTKFEVYDSYVLKK